MKKLYWRPNKVPRIVLLVISFITVAGMASVELFKTNKRQPYYSEKMIAAQAMKDATEYLKNYRVKRIGPIDQAVDPCHSGLIGLETSPITSNFGSLPSKQTSVNPNWAAVLVEMLRKGGVKDGDTIAVAFSGSFPAINLAVYSAAQALNLKVIAVTSVASSTWGANIPAFTWLDMEKILLEGKVFSYRSVAASLGGQQDRALARSKKGRDLLREAIRRNGVEALDEETFSENIDARIRIYNREAKGEKMRAYVNVGGGTVSVGMTVGKKLYKPGLNRKPGPAALRVESVMSRFAREGVPIIHMVYIKDLAESYEIPVTPKEMPNVGEGRVFGKTVYNLYLVSANILVLLFILYVFLKSDIGFRIFGSSRMTQAPKHPEPMV
jgi:poly-gamma-glutamate system protein